jgi:hypothetical protein
VRLESRNVPQRRRLPSRVAMDGGTLDAAIVWAEGVRFQLPPLRPSDIVLHAGLTDIGSRDTLRTLASAFRARFSSHADGEA